MVSSNISGPEDEERWSNKVVLELGIDPEAAADVFRDSGRHTIVAGRVADVRYHVARRSSVRLQLASDTGSETDIWL